MSGDNLMTALLNEIERNAKLAEIYKSIGPSGIFGARMIDLDVKAAREAIADMDVVAMMRCYKALKGSQA